MYYDCLVPRPKGVALTAAKEHLTLRNQAAHPVFDVTVVDRRTPERPRLARLERLNADESQAVRLTDCQGIWPRPDAKTLRKQLVAAGLTHDEAESLIEIWGREFFGSQGLTMWYRLPQEEYERLLPLTLKPLPEKLVRVGLVQHVFADPRQTKRVAQLVQELDDDSFERREAAHQALDSMGRAALAPLVHLRKDVRSAEVKRHINELLSKYDVDGSLRK